VPDRPPDSEPEPKPAREPILDVDALKSPGSRAAREELKRLSEQSKAVEREFEPMRRVDEEMARMRRIAGAARPSVDFIGPIKSNGQRTSDAIEAMQRAMGSVEAQRAEREQAMVNALDAVADELRAEARRSVRLNNLTGRLLVLTVVLILIASATLVATLV
jgi:DnaJ-domain-containing protein 1